MTLELFIKALVGLLPVSMFLGALLLMDSYKLVRFRSILLVIGLGGLTAGASYLVHLVGLRQLDMELISYSRYVAPILEEILKGAVIIYLLRRNRIGFLVDAAIFGFAVGTGFAMVENVYFLQILPDSHIGVWIIRGFGTAIMHGGAVAIFAMSALALTERSGRIGHGELIPGLLMATVLHSMFNHFFFSPIFSALGVMIVLPPLIFIVFQQSERAVEEWLDVGFDADAELLELINSGELSKSHVGEYLLSLKEKFQGPIVADLLCYLRVHVELALKAKGVMMMREGGFEPEIGVDVHAKFEELVYLERSIGKTGVLALKPFLHLSRKDLWQLYMLGK